MSRADSKKFWLSLENRRSSKMELPMDPSGNWGRKRTLEVWISIQNARKRQSTGGGKSLQNWVGSSFSENNMQIFLQNKWHQPSQVFKLQSEIAKNDRDFTRCFHPVYGLPTGCLHFEGPWRPLKFVDATKWLGLWEWFPTYKNDQKWR